MDISKLVREILKFRDARDWGPFHTPKDLAAALSIETSELQELFLWKSENEIAEFVMSAQGKGRLAEEIGDVLIYLLLFSHEVNIDPIRAAQAKLAENAKKYPVHLARGKATKYTELTPIKEDRQDLVENTGPPQRSKAAQQQPLFPQEPPLVH